MEQLQLGPHLVRALSVGGMETCIELPALKFCFDLGRCPWSATKLPTVLFTHSHMDHMGGIVIHCATRNLKGQSPPTYYMPTEKVEGVGRVFEAWRSVDGSRLPCTMVGVSPGDEWVVGQNRTVRAFRAVHTTPALGYAIVHTRQKLKPEYHGRKDIGVLRQAGVEVTYEEQHTELVFCGDTSIDTLDREPWIYEADDLLLEVTFLDDRVDPASARRHGHVHLDHVLERAELFQNKRILFTHFSSRYRRKDIVECLERRLPRDLRERVTALLPER